MKTITIYSVKKFYIKDNRYWTYGGFGEYIKAIAPYFDKIILCIHAKKASNEILKGYYTIDIPNIEYRHLPWYRNELECLIKLPWMLIKSIWYARDADIINARVPDYSGICGAIAAKIFKKPIFFNVVDDWAEEAECPATKLKGIMKRGLIAHLKLYVKIEEFLVSKSLAFIQGESAYKRYINNPKAHLVVSTSINKDDITKDRHPPCVNEYITLLSVGRLQREKGHIYLLEAFKILKKKMNNIKLKIIGEGNLKKEFLDWIKENGFEGDIELPGMITHGPELFKVYKNSDIFILPSISEGTPKVILEAMACGLPVIATKVGGVPTLIKDRDNGLLVPRQNAGALADAINEIIENKVLRCQLIESGYKTAEEHTNDAEMYKIIKTLKNEYPQLFT